MRASQLSLSLLTIAGCLVGHLGWAQRAAVAPLAPLPPMVRPASPKALLEGEPLTTQRPHQAPATAAAAPTARRVWPDPVILLNSRIVVSEFDIVKPNDILHLEVYKGANVPAQWQSLTEIGLIDITVKPGAKLRLKTKSLNALRRQVKAAGLVSFKLNGMRLEDNSLRVATAAIAGLDVVRDEYETVINIRLAPRKPSPPRHDPPGTIYIRGVATR